MSATSTARIDNVSEGEYFTQITDSLLNLPITWAAMCLYVKMTLLAGPRNQLAITNTELAELMEFSRRHIIRLLNELEDNGLIERVPTRKGYANVYNLYRFATRKPSRPKLQVIGGGKPAYNQQPQSVSKNAPISYATNYPTAPSQPAKKISYEQTENQENSISDITPKNVTLESKFDTLDANIVTPYTEETAVLPHKPSKPYILIHDLNTERENRAYAQEPEQTQSDKTISQSQTATVTDDTAYNQVAQSATPEQEQSEDTSKVLLRQLEAAFVKAGVGPVDAAHLAEIGLEAGKGVDWVERLVERAGKSDIKSPVSLIVFLGKQGAEPGEYRTRQAGDYRQAVDSDGADNDAAVNQPAKKPASGSGNNKSQWRGGYSKNNNAAQLSSGGTIDFSKYEPGGKYGHLVSVVAACDETELEAEVQTTPETGVSDEVAIVAANESMAAHDIPTTVIDVSQTNEPCDSAGDNCHMDEYEYDSNIPIPGFIGELSLDPLVPYRVKPAAATVATPVHQTEIIAPVAVLDVPTQTVAEPVAAAPVPAIIPQTSIGFDSESDPRLAKALQLLEAYAALVADANIANNDRQEPTLTVTFLAGKKPDAIRLEQWKHALHFHPATRAIKNIVMKELQPEPESSEVTKASAYSYNFQPKPCEQTAAPVADGIESAAWKVPAIAKCLELLDDDAALVRDIRIGPNWINQLAVMVSFEVDNQPSEQTLKDWKHKVLHGFNKELRGKEIKEVEVTLLKPTSCANADIEKAVKASEELEPSSSGVVELASENSQMIETVANSDLSKLAPEVAAAIEREIEAEVGMEASEDVGQPEFNNAPVQAGEPESRVGDSSSGDIGNGGSDQSSDATEPSADELQELARLKALRDEAALGFNFGLAHSYPANDWLAFVGPNSEW